MNESTPTTRAAQGPDSPDVHDKAVRPYVPEDSKPRTAVKESASVILGGAGILIAILLLTTVHLVHPASSAAKKSILQPAKTAQPAQSLQSVIPLTDTDHSDQKVDGQAQVSSDDVARTATPHSQPLAANLGGIQPFDSQHPWEPAAYQPNQESGESADTNEDSTDDKDEKEALAKASLVFAKNVQPAPIAKELALAPVDPGIGLPPGTKLRARIEAAVSTAAQTPVMAVVEYNYEKNSEILIPAGAKALGHVESADATGYINVRFDSLLMPDGSSLPIEATAVDLGLRPVKGKVEGKHAGKNILVRSVAGLGEITATLAGRGSLDQPLSEGDLIRERAATNIAQASDEQIASLAVTQRIVVTVPANTEIYVVLGKPARVNDSGSAKSPPGNLATASNTEQLRQLLQLQRELNQQSDTIAKQ